MRGIKKGILLQALAIILHAYTPTLLQVFGGTNKKIDNESQALPYA